METRPYRSWVEISLSQIAKNFQSVKTAVGPKVEVMPVVKADAYRHGAVEVSRTLEAHGANWLAVSNVEEGVALRQAGIQTRILVMADFLPWSRQAMLEHNLTPVLPSLDEVRELDAMGKPANYHLKIDSGMGRLGTRAAAAEIYETIRNARSAKLEGLMTHFASVTNFNTRQTEDQEQTFFEIAAYLKDAGAIPKYVHLASTGAIAHPRPEAWRSMVRPGISIYGYVSPAKGKAPPQILEVKPALTWKASVLTVKEVPAGALIGYGGMYRAPAAMRIAILAVGYADGIPHRLSNRGKVIFEGHLLPILGAVSMDLTTIDATPCLDLKPGDAVTILGEEGEAKIDAQQIARQAGTISYSVLCGISSRVKRIYI
jgi:alanine racemase